MNCNHKFCPGVNDFYIKPTQAAQYLGISTHKLKCMRQSDSSPTFIRYESGAVMYSGESVKRYAKKLPKKSTPKVEPLDLF